MPPWVLTDIVNRRLCDYIIAEMLYCELIESSITRFKVKECRTSSVRISCFWYTMIQNSPLARKLGAYVALSQAELAVLADLHQKRRTFAAGRDIVHQGQSNQSAY